MTNTKIPGSLCPKSKLQTKQTGKWVRVNRFHNTHLQQNLRCKQTERPRSTPFSFHSRLRFRFLSQLRSLFKYQLLLSGRWLIFYSLILHQILSIPDLSIIISFVNFEILILLLELLLFFYLGFLLTIGLLLKYYSIEACLINIRISDNNMYLHLCFRGRNYRKWAFRRNLFDGFLLIFLIWDSARGFPLYFGLGWMLKLLDMTFVCLFINDGSWNDKWKR